MERIAARLLGERPGIDPGRNLAPLSLDAVSRFQLVDGVLYRLDRVLTLAESREVGLSPDAQLLAATDDLRCFVAAENNGVILGTDELRALDISHADNAVFIPGDRVLVTAPIIDVGIWNGEPYERRTAHEVLLVDTDSGAVLDRTVLEVSNARVMAVPHPRDGSVLLDAGEGQDGSRIFVARCVNDRIATELVLENAVAPAFSPSGARLLITPHPSFGTEARVLAWPELTSLAGLTPIAAGVDGFDFYGCFLSEDAILLKTHEGGIVLADAGLGFRAFVTVGAAVGDEIEALCALGNSMFAVVVWRDGVHTTSVWELDLSSSG